MRVAFPALYGGCESETGAFLTIRAACRDSTPNRSLVLVRFREASSASEFRRMYNGKPYHDSKDVSPWLLPIRTQTPD